MPELNSQQRCTSKHYGVGHVNEFAFHLSSISQTAMAEYFSSLAVSLNPQNRNIAMQADTMLMAGQFQHFSQASFTFGCFVTFLRQSFGRDTASNQCLSYS